MSLIDEIKSGSSEAIKQLYQENAQDVYDFAKGITGNHDTAMQATKNTLNKLVQQIQSGKEPANIHSEALKLAYDEACKIAMPSIKNVKSPYDEESETAKQPKRSKSEQTVSRSRDYDDYDEEDDEEEYEEPARKPAPRKRPQERDSRREYDNRRRPQPESRRRRDDYYEDDYDDYDDDYYDDGYDDDYDDYPKKKHGAGFVICLIINIILILILIWFVLGLLMNLGVVSETFSKYGYEWFNNTIYPLF